MYKKRGFNIYEVARALGVSHDTIRREITKKKLGTVKVGGQYLITQPDLEKYLGSRERYIALFGYYLPEEDRSILTELGIRDTGQTIHRRMCTGWMYDLYFIIDGENINGYKVFHDQNIKPEHKVIPRSKFEVIDREAMFYESLFDGKNEK